MEWIERAMQPLRPGLTDERFERLVSALALVVGWEALTVLRDVRGLDGEQEEAVLTWSARALVEAMLAEAGPGAPRRPVDDVAAGGVRSRAWDSAISVEVLAMSANRICPASPPLLLVQSTTQWLVALMA